MSAMSEQDCLDAIAEGADAYELVCEHAPHLERKWKRLCKSMRDFMAEAQRTFPDAQYYTASGGLNLLLGSPHGGARGTSAQRELLALNSDGINIGDGDF